GRWRSILHVSVSLFAIDVPHGVFGIRSRCSAVRIRAERAVLIPNEPLLRLVPHNRWLGRKKMAPPELREGPSSSAEVTTNWDLCPGADNPTSARQGSRGDECVLRYAWKWANRVCFWFFWYSRNSLKSASRCSVS